MHLNPFPGVKTMSKENLKKLRLADKTILTDSFGTATVTKHFIGNLALPTGRIIMCDPYEKYSLSDIDRKRAFEVLSKFGKFFGNPRTHDFGRGEEKYKS